MQDGLSISRAQAGGVSVLRGSRTEVDVLFLRFQGRGDLAYSASCNREGLHGSVLAAFAKWRLAQSREFAPAECLTVAIGPYG